MDIEQIVEQLRAERNRLDEAITVLGGSGTEGRTNRRGPRHMSAEARRRISHAQKRRWAKQRGSKGPALVTTSSAAATPKPRGGMSAAGRKRLSLMMKRRWAERRKKAA
jgi:hypothetical protein